MLLSVTLISHPLQQTHVTMDKICRHFIGFVGAFTRLLLPGADCFLQLIQSRQTADQIPCAKTSRNCCIPRFPPLPTISRPRIRRIGTPPNQTRQRCGASLPHLFEVPHHGPPCPLCVDQHCPPGMAECNVQVGGTLRQQVRVNHRGIFLRYKICKYSPLFLSSHLGGTCGIFLPVPSQGRRKPAASNGTPNSHSPKGGRNGRHPISSQYGCMPWREQSTP